MENRKKLIVLAIILVLVMAAGVIGVVASVPGYKITEAILAADVCAEHLDQDCTVCTDARAVYRIYCPVCQENGNGNIEMIQCCSEQMKENDYHATCYIWSHPDGCETIQDQYWNAYFCTECSYFERGGKNGRDDDYHIEAYAHSLQTDVFDHAYCSLPRLSDLLLYGKGDASGDDPAAELQTPGAEPTTDPVAAGDYCEVHDVFACRIPHNDVE